jgi:diguanylate cyclase (GGDEF)-like protein
MVSNGLEALGAASAPDAPRLLILDWVMPGLHGPEVCQRLRQNPTSELYQYIVLLSAKKAKSDAVEGLEAGADDYLTKPFDAQELLARLRGGVRILELQDRLLDITTELEYEATHDSLTGLWNQLAWRKLLTAEWERACRKKCNITVLMVDIDHFKVVNDTYGHCSGDAVLRAVGNTLRNMVRVYDVAGRYGGEEFAIAASELEPAALTDYAERIRAAVAALTVFGDEGEISVTVSMGVAHTESPEAYATEQLLRAADHALYKAKARGRNCVVIKSFSGRELASSAHDHATSVESP